MLSKGLFHFFYLLFLFFYSTQLWAQGVTADTIFIGRTAGITGTIAGPMKEQNDAIIAYFEHINKQGGINGRKLNLKILDDKFDPKLAGENAKTLINEGAFLLFMPRGTPHSEAVLKVTEPAGVPVVAPSTGAEIFHTPFKRLVFNVRATYQAEVIEGIRYLSGIGQKKLALIHVNDSFGKDGLAGYEKGVKQYGVQTLFIGTYDRVKSDSNQHIPKLLALQPDAVILVGSGVAVTGLIKEARQQGLTAQFLTLSNVSSASFIKDLGDAAPGVLVMQVTPPPDSVSVPMSAELKAIAPNVARTYAAMEAFASSKVLVEGLRRAGRNLNRERFITAMESLKRFDLGDMQITYGPNDRTGSTFVEISIINRAGRFMR